MNIGAGVTQLFHYHKHTPEIVLSLHVLFSCLTLCTPPAAITGSRLPSFLIIILPE